ncbi:MAG: hypothetical protein KAS96_12480 [Planctomycetes bacterium]|nr:hypothetical protein [Planctomycetota bacterium]
MTNSYGSLCDDFYFDMYVNTELELPAQRDTILSFFERVQKQYPSMGNFYRRGKGEYFLEENSSTGQFSWLGLESDRISCGAVNPQELEHVCAKDRFILDLIPYMLGVNYLDIDCIDVVFGMDFSCRGNHDEIIAEAFLNDSAFNSLLDLPQSKVTEFSPMMTVSLSEDNLTQARIKVESKTSVFEPGKPKDKTEEAISLYVTIRQYPASDKRFDSIASFDRQYEILDNLMTEKVIGSFVKPLTDVIAHRNLS